MMFFNKRSSFCLGLVLAGLTVSLQASVSGLDTSHSRLSVTFKQMGVPVEGQFTRFSGTLDYDPADPAAATAELRIDTRSFDLGLEDFNAEVAKAEWLDSQTHPEAVYRVTALAPLGDNRFRADGSLTLKGRSAPLPAEMQMREEDSRRLFTGDVRFDRQTFGVGDKGWDGVVDNEVRVRFQMAQPLP